MSFLDSDRGRKLFNQYLKKFKGASQRVYRSEVQQFSDFSDCGISEITRDTLDAYRDHIASKHSPKTTKRKFSILNGFFKFLEKKVKGFRNPITTLKDFRTHKGIESEGFKKYLDDFLASLKTSNTRKTYRNLIKLFITWIGRPVAEGGDPAFPLGKDLTEITTADIFAYRDYLRENKNKDATVWNKMIALNRLFKFIAEKNRKFKNPIVFKNLDLEVPKKDRGDSAVLSTKDAEKFLKQPNRRTAIGKRDYTLLLIALVYGLRANEIAKLRHRDLESERVKGQQKLWIMDRKGKFKKRTSTGIILSGRTLRAFDAWIETVAAAGVTIGDDLPIFLPFIYDRSTQGLVIRRDRLKNPLSVQSIENIVSKYIRKAKIAVKEGEVISPHALRHTAFTHLAREGVSIQDIQKLAGHKNIATTMIYIHAAQSYEDHPGLHSPLNK